MEKINESLSKVIYHFCNFNNTYNIVLSDRLFMTSAYNTNSDLKFQRGKLFYISFTRQFNSNVGYAKEMNDMYDNQYDKETGEKLPQDASKLWTRITLDGEALSANYKGTQVNNPSHGNDLVTNRQAEDRIISDKPYIDNISKYIISIDILLPVIKPKREKMIRTMLISGKAGGKIKIFTNEKDFNTIGSRNYMSPKNFFVNKKGEYANKKGEYVIDDINPYDKYSVGHIPDIANAMVFVAYGENINPQELMNTYNLVPLKYRGEVEQKFYEKLNKVNSIGAINSFARQFSNLRFNIKGESKWIYGNLINMITNYMREKGFNSFNELISYKRELFRNAAQQNYNRIAVGENFNIRIKQIIQEVLDNVVKKKINAVIFDFDGTLVDTTAIDEFRSVAKKIKDPQERLDYYRKFFQETKVYPGIVNLLNALNAMGVVVAIVSLSPKNMVQDLCKFHNLPINMNFVLTDGKKFNLVKGFQTGYSKSTIYRKIMEKLGIQPYSVLAVGDEITDEQQAKIAGINFIGCSWGGRNETSNSVSNPADVLRYVKGEI